MFNVLIVNNSQLDKKNYKDIILANTADTQVFTASEIGAAENVLRKENIHLLIADVSQYSDYIKKMLSFARSNSPQGAVLFTSVMREEELEQLALKYGVDGYLSKPVLPNKLMEKILPFVKKREEEEEVRGAKELHSFLRRLDAAIKEYSYREAMDIIKSSISFIYDSIRDVDVIKRLILAMAEGLCYTVEMGKESTAGVERELRLMKKRIDIQGGRYEILRAMQNMLDIIFDSFESGEAHDISPDQKIMNYIERNVWKSLKLDEAADYANMNSSYFSKYFKKMTDINYIDYMTARKIDEAIDLLDNTDIPISNIAQELSFTSTNYFSKVFKKSMGVTPTEYRSKTG